MPKFIIDSVYLLKNKPKMHYIGDISGVLHFKNLSTGEVYQAPLPEVEFEVPKVSVPKSTASTATTKVKSPSSHKTA